MLCTGLRPFSFKKSDEIATLTLVISFLVAVAAGVTCHLICKWLDSHNKDNE